MEYFEHKKLAKIKDQSQAIGEFLDWLETEKEIYLCEYMLDSSGDKTDILVYNYTPKNKLLAEFFNINLKKLEAEKIHMIEMQRYMNRG